MVIRESEDPAKWVSRWEKARAFEANPDQSRVKIFVNFPFSYMNGPLHLGHIFSASRLDAYARFKRMQGFNVLFPWAWHWTGQPVVSAAQRLKEGDAIQTRILVEMDKIPPTEVKKFVDPVYMASFYTKENRETVRRLGLSIDWRREFTSTSHEPLFSRFVEWQYNRLREKGYVVQGTHPVVWCPRDKSPTQDHDRLEGEGVAPEDYTLVKFRLKDDDAFIVAGTLRPETIAGVTNLWVNPSGTYVRAKVDGETWITSREAAAKLGEQLMQVSIISEAQGKDLVGKTCMAPVVNREVPILPALFVNTDSVSGAVYSVPAHAPFDWLALRDLKSSDPRLGGSEASGLASGVEPISIISVPGFGELPAVELVDRIGAKDQLDPKAEQATKDLYNKEFHLGKMKDNCGAYSGMSVAQAKDKVAEDLRSTGLASHMYDLSELVVCRCNTRCIVKVLQDQWFLTYNDKDWKERSIMAVKDAAILPPESRNQLIQTINWLKEYPCARKTGLGTPLPWDKDWLVETLSDSTIYMAFYTIVLQLRQSKVKPEQMTDEAFDFVFWGKGDPSKMEKDSNLPEGLLVSLRSEFSYWYPVDLRNSGKDLVSNHLTFFVMHHVALFDQSLWPRSISVNGMVQLEGARMSKSHGVFVSAKEAIARFGSDACRATLLSSAEALDDPDWRSKNAQDMAERLSSLADLSARLLANSEERALGQMDIWLLARLKDRIDAVGQSMEQMKTRTAFYNAFFAPWNDLRWYMRRTKPAKEAVKTFFLAWSRMLSPFVPFVAEELNERLGSPELASASPWPQLEGSPFDAAAQASEELVQGVLEDIKGITEVVKGPVSEALILVADPSSIKQLSEVFAELSGGRSDGEIIRSMVQGAQPGAKATAATGAQAMIKYCRDRGMETLARELANPIDEEAVISGAAGFISRESGLGKVTVKRYDPASQVKKGRVPFPLKPLILLS